MLREGAVAANKFLIALLPLAGVVKAAVWTPVVHVAVAPSSLGSEKTSTLGERRDGAIPACALPPKRRCSAVRTTASPGAMSQTGTLPMMPRIGLRPGAYAAGAEHRSVRSRCPA